MQISAFPSSTTAQNQTAWTYSTSVLGWWYRLAMLAQALYVQRNGFMHELANFVGGIAGSHAAG